MRWLRRTSARFASFLPSFLFPLTQFGLVLGLLGGIAFLGTRLQDRFGLGEIRESFLAQRQFIFDDQPVR